MSITTPPYTLPTDYYGTCTPCLWFNDEPECSYQWLAILELCQQPECQSSYSYPLSLTSTCSGRYTLALPEATMTRYSHHGPPSNSLHFEFPGGAASSRFPSADKTGTRRSESTATATGATGVTASATTGGDVVSATGSLVATVVATAAGTRTFEAAACGFWVRVGIVFVVGLGAFYQ